MDDLAIQKPPLLRRRFPGPHRRKEWSSSTRTTHRMRFKFTFIRYVLNLMQRGVGLRTKDMNDRHRDMRLDVDNMSYEELLALGERIGDVCTGVTEATIMKHLKQHKFADNREESQVETEPCSICRKEYIDGEDLGRLECGHGFHKDCIKQWLVQKNSCPICKKTGLTPRKKKIN